MIEAEPLKLPSIAHGFFTRGGGVSTGLFASLNCGLGSGDDMVAVTRNRESVARQLGLPPESLVTAYQVHSPKVINVTTPWKPEDRPQLDAMVTSTKGVALGVLTADCGPILFADPKASVIGAAHAGWKGALAGVTTSVIEAMEQLGAARENIIAVIGPTISQSNYEVGPGFPETFTKADPADQQFFAQSVKSGHQMFDLPAYIAGRLKRQGITRIHDLGLCTYADEARFFSYRRATHRGETDYGRLMSAIALV